MIGLGSILSDFASENASKNAVKNLLENQLPHTNTDNVLKNVINVLLYAAGTIAVVMIIISGIKISSSSGDSSAVAKGKKTLLAALIGLAVVVLAFTIVNFVMTAVTGQ